MTHRDFRVVKAWELEAWEVVERGPLALVPLVPLMRGADEEVVRAGVRTRFDLSGGAVESLATQLQKVDESEVLRQLLVDAALE